MIFKKFKYLFMALLLGVMMIAPMAEAAPDVTVKVDGNVVAFPDQKPYIDSNDRTMVPVRAPMEAMGCQVDWGDQTRQATITKGETTAAFTIGSNTYAVNGQNKTMDTQAVITGGCIFIFLTSI
ncbi:copper amine oxidase N-terminal domain-containing protein [Lactobacillus acetotolerans]|jgi:type 1 fimbria pilin|uniref:copper amine oxidase N-terminal domain-containing protein n=1 Tax=Lactobacillus acetotolerans TaxID=1600 RepID=UPI00241C291D|nr:copper amine oxidase N-terminal domain-containing protein [Lactobacillus acetotolerans]